MQEWYLGEGEFNVQLSDLGTYMQKKIISSICVLKTHSAPTAIKKRYGEIW